MIEIALAYVIANPDCSTTILGAIRVSQLEENVKAVDAFKKLDKEI